MTFEYRDAYGRVLTADHGLDDNDNPMAVLWSRGEFGASVPVRIPADRVEEVVAGIRDAARTAARQTTGQDNTAPTPCSVPVVCEPGGEPCSRHEREQSHADGEHELCGAECPAVGQPAETHDTEARPSVHRWGTELYAPLTDEWIPTTHYLVRDRALAALAYLRARAPKWKDGTPVERRLVRETTTWTVEDDTAPAPEPAEQLVHVGWWCWHGDNHGHLGTHPCRSDNVPIHVPTEWAGEMTDLIQHLTDDHDPAETCTWTTPEDQAAETRAAADTAEDER
ncbi:MAG TPA: hypothetical protein VF049_22280 [Nocardioidaceae bacterium]